MVSALGSRLRGSGASPGHVIVLCSWARHFAVKVSLATQEYKWVPANKICQTNDGYVRTSLSDTYVTNLGF